jgi:hypothetical protein
MAGDDHSEGHVELRAQDALGVEEDGDDPHRLLRVDAAMAEAEQR